MSGRMNEVITETEKTIPQWLTCEAKVKSGFTVNVKVCMLGECN